MREIWRNYDWKHLRFQSYVLFTLVWRVKETGTAGYFSWYNIQEIKKSIYDEMRWIVSIHSQINSLLNYFSHIFYFHLLVLYLPLVPFLPSTSEITIIFFSTGFYLWWKSCQNIKECFICWFKILKLDMGYIFLFWTIFWTHEQIFNTNFNPIIGIIDNEIFHIKFKMFWYENKLKKCNNLSFSN